MSDWSQNAQSAAADDLGSRPVGSPVQPCEKATLEPLLEVEETPVFALELEIPEEG